MFSFCFSCRGVHEISIRWIENSVRSIKEEEKEQEGGERREGKNDKCYERKFASILKGVREMESRVLMLSLE